MTENEKSIIKAFASICKKIGGRGPKNIHIKENDLEIEIHFLLCKSVAEIYILNNLPDGLDILKEMHKEIFAIVSKDFNLLFNENLPFEVKIKDFQFDIATDKYLIILEKL